MTFPLRTRPNESYHRPPRAFGCRRDVTPQHSEGLRQHAGCDLYAPPGTPIFAARAGKVIRACYLFYKEERVLGLDIQHEDGSIARYGEISAGAAGIQLGAIVQEGQVVALVGRMAHLTQAMLHFELYSGTGVGPLTDLERPKFFRRADLIDPTPLLDAAVLIGGQP